MTSSSRDGDTGMSVAELLSALFEHASGSLSGQGWTGKQIAARTAEFGPVAVGASYLSQLRVGGSRHPSVWAVEALARAFEVDVVFFTHAFHDHHVGLPMCERVQLARYLATGTTCEATIAALEDLPDAQQRAVLALIDILASRS